MSEKEALLAQLRDIQSPDVSLMPAAGWWMLLLGVALVTLLLFRFYKRYQRRGWQREARASLARLRAEAGKSPVSQSLSATSKLVRRVVLAARPREEVASLEGEAWLDALDDICGKPLFKSGFGQLLDQGPYQRSPQLSTDDLHALLDVVSELIDAAGRPSSRRSPT